MSIDPPPEPVQRSGGGVLGVPRAALGYANRVRHTAQNVSEFVRFGGLETHEEHAPYAVAAEQATYRLRHYFADDTPADAAPIILVPPLMLTAEVWDVSPASSAVTALHAQGIDPWVVDFGRPDVEPGGLERTLTDHVLAVNDAVDRVSADRGRPVILAGYSQGGMFAYQAAAYRRNKDLDSLVTFGSPVDSTAPLPIPISPQLAQRLAGELAESGLLSKVSLPGWAARLGFKLLTPAKAVQDRVRYLLALNNRDALLPREKQRRFLDNDGWTAWSGPAIREFLDQFVAHNRMLEGGFVIDDRLVTLADIEVPILTFVGTTDTLGHPLSVRGIRRAAPRAPIYEDTLPAGHFGLVVGSTAREHTWPAVASWVHWRGGTGPLEEEIVPAESVSAPARLPRPNATAAALTELGVGVARTALGSAVRTARLARGVAREAPAQLPRLARLEQLDPRTRISLGQLVDEQARKAPEDIAFLFGDRAHRQRELKRRSDYVVKGLISIGVRHGDRVGVLMSTRPSAYSVLIALSRLGATAVLLRPDGDVPQEIALARVGLVIIDPDHVELVERVDGVRWAVLGGGSGARDLPAAVLDMEQIDPDAVERPAWYRPNPQRAGDIAFVLFAGEGEGTQVIEISNRRWALSALGTAAAAALRPSDTVYSVTPIHHSSALLMSIGGAVAGGARLAFASGTDPDTFWEEVRRYGASHVSYTWTSLDDIVNAPPNPGEQHHPIRMFLGSGMPRNLWKRVTERFPGVKVLEFYAAADGEAILANVAGVRPGSMGRPIPGTSEVRVAAYDLTARQLELSADGLGRECDVDEVGLLLARVDPADPGGAPPLRGVFDSGDAWYSTGDLFLRDEHGDLWLAGPVSEIVDTAAGPALPAGARFALGTIPALDIIVAYGVPEGDAHVLVAAVTLRSGMTISAAELTTALDRLPRRLRPRYVQVVPEIPVTTWHRPLWRPLQDEGVPTPGSDRSGAGRVVWRLDDDSGHYQQLA